MNTDTPIKLTNPLSDHPTEMWSQAIADFEKTLGTPGYEIDMSYWYEHSLEESCLVCMAGASMARRTEGLTQHVSPGYYSEQDRRKFESINMMRKCDFELALEYLRLPMKDEERWLEAIQAADLKGLRLSVYSVNLRKDWRGLIELLREAIARIDAEYAGLPAEPAEPALPPDDHPGWDRLTDALNTR